MVSDKFFSMHIWKMLLVTCLCLVSAGTSTRAQTVAEWTQQKKTQLDYLLKQVAALRAYTEVAAKGYAIAKQGLTAIKKIKQVEASLHEDYFTSLRNVNPHVKAYWKVAAATSLQMQVLQQCRQEQQSLQANERSSASEKRYVASVLNNLSRGCAALVESLSQVTTGDSLQLRDDERLRRIDALYAAIEERYIFLQQFCSEQSLLDQQCRQAKIDLKILRALY
jgi:hypothetical protein